MIYKLVPNSWKRRVILSLHAGDKYCCPICSYQSKDLYKIGIDTPVLVEKQVIGAGVRNAGCYKCHSTDRVRLIYLYLKDVLNVFDRRDMRILHMAPEKGISRVLNDVDFNNYVCGDLFTEGYEYPDYVRNMNVLDIPYADNYFDLIICNHLLEHVPNDKDAMAELFRVLKKGGQAILQVPISQNSEQTFEDFSITSAKEREVVFGQFDHLRIYGQDYEARLSSVGFQVKRTNISHEYPNAGLNPVEDIFIGMK